MAGENWDPLVGKEDDLGTWSESLLSSIGMTPRYSYRKGVNVLHFRLRSPRRNPALGMLASVAAGLSIGLLGMAALPESTKTLLIQTTLDPIQSVFSGSLILPPAQSFSARS